MTYAGNGSTGGAAPVDPNACFSGTTVTVLANTGSLVRAGYAFAGWNTAADGSGTNYPATGSATFAMGAADVTLYAKWTSLETGGVPMLSGLGAALLALALAGAALKRGALGRERPRPQTRRRRGTNTSAARSANATVAW